MALRFDLSGNSLPGPADRMKPTVARRDAPEKQAAPDLTAATLKALEARIAGLETSLREALEAIDALIDDITDLRSSANVTRDSVTSVTRDVTGRDEEKRQKAAERQRRRREKMKAQA